MTGAAPAALVALHEFLGGRTTEDLAQAVGITHSGAVRLIDRLVEAGLVERRPGRDGRSGSIVLTARGRALSLKVGAARAEAIDAALESLDGDDSETLLRLIEDLTAAITRFRLRARARRDEPAAWLCRLCDFGACGRPEGRCPAANAARGG
jgi:DNA-binding MarR family transcriptional regulator